MRKYCELLAPAGSTEHLMAAVENGADAVYLGGKLFGARANAGNFNDEELKSAVAYAHLRNVKIYVTMNTLIEQSQLADALRYATFLYEIGVDALIIQDWGLARVVHAAMPNFPLHLSTQGSVCNKEGVLAAAGMGFERVVLAREMPLEEIAECSAVSEAEIEVFVHGALCICYSGQCHMSRLRGGRSGNKGACAQPCRLPYTRGKEKSHLLSPKDLHTRGKEKSHLLSPKDLCLVEDLDRLISAGVSSLKIEGRMKSPEYVAVVTSIYRKYLDAYYEKGASKAGANETPKANEDEASKAGENETPKVSENETSKAGENMTSSVSENDRHRLKAIFNRGGFTRGYIFGNPGKDLMFPEIAKNQGVHVGEVVGIEKRGVVSISPESEAELFLGDGVELRGPNTKTGNVVTYLKKEGKKLLIGDFKGNTEIGARIYKVTDKQLLNEARATYEKVNRAVDIKMRFTAYAGEVPVLEVWETGARGDRVVVRGEDIVETAQNKALTEETVIRQMEKTRESPFKVRTIDVLIEDNLFIPVSTLNQLRRKALDALAEKKIGRGKRQPVEIDAEAVLEACSQVPGNGGENDVAGKSCGLTGLDGVGAGTLTIFFRRVADFSAFSLPPDLKDVEIRYCIPLADYMEAAFSPEGTEEYEKTTRTHHDTKTMGLEGKLGCSHTTGKRILPYINTISKGEEDAYIRKNFRAIVEKCKSTGIYIGNIGWIAPFADAGVEVHGGFGLNVTNSAACAAIIELGARTTDTSLEIHPEHATAGAVPVMVTEHQFVCRRDGASDKRQTDVCIIKAGAVVATGGQATQYKVIAAKDKNIVVVDAAPNFKALKAFVNEGKEVFAFI